MAMYVDELPCSTTNAIKILFPDISFQSCRNKQMSKADLSKLALNFPREKTIEMISWGLRIGRIAFILCIAVAARPGSSLFSYHPILMTTAFTGLMTEALLIFSKSGLAGGFLHSSRVTLHWILIILAGICHSLGFAAIYFNKEFNEKPHFTSWHGRVGLLATILLIVQLSVGVFAKYPKLLNFCMKIRTVKMNHALFGVTTFSLGMIATLLGFWSNWFANNASMWVSYSSVGLHIILLVMMTQKIIKKYIL